MLCFEAAFMVESLEPPSVPCPAVIPRPSSIWLQVGRGEGRPAVLSLGGAVNPGPKRALVAKSELRLGVGWGVVRWGREGVGRLPAGCHAVPPPSSAREAYPELHADLLGYFCSLVVGSTSEARGRASSLPALPVSAPGLQ